MTAHHEQSGSALILAIAFILAMGLGITALLSFLHAGMNASTVVREQGGDLYAVEAAVESVIAELRMDTLLGVGGEPCGPFPRSINGRSVTVTCTADPASRQVSTPGGSPASGQPEGAIVALGSEGVDFQNNAVDKKLTIGGDIVSEGPVTVTNGTISVDGTVYAPSCGGSGLLEHVSAPDVPLTCDSNKSPTDPNWALPSATQPVAQTLAPGAHCSTGAAVPAGTYTDAQAWNDLVANCGTGSAPGTIRFEGVYYLDFADDAGCTVGDGPEWCINNNNVTLTAGTYSGGSCSGTGAVFVLGGSTRISVRAGTLQLCGYAVAGGPTLSIYAKSPPAAPPSGPTTGTATLTASTASVPNGAGNPGFTPADEGRITDADLAGVSVTPSGGSAPKAASITLTGWSGDAVPAGATITKVVARVTHRETPGTTSAMDPSRLTATATTSTTGTAGIRASLAFDDVDVTAAGFTPASLTAATLKWESTPISGPYSAAIDGVELVVDYTLPAGPATAPWGTLTCTSAPCTVLDTDGNQARASFFGTIYTPESRVHLKAVNLATAAASRGIVVRTLSVHVPTIVDPDSFHIALEGGGAGPPVTSDGFVTLIATLDGRQRLSTDVTLPDGAGVFPTDVEIANWSIE